MDLINAGRDASHPALVVYLDARHLTTPRTDRNERILKAQDPCGDGGRVLSLTPPLTIGRDALLAAIDTLVELLCERSG